MHPLVNSKFVLMDHWFIVEMLIGKIQIVQEKSMIVTIFNYIDNHQLERLIIKTDKNSSRTLSKTSATCWCREFQGNLRLKWYVRKSRKTRAKGQGMKETVMFLHLLMADQAVKTKKILVIRKYIKLRIPDMVKVTLTILAKTCLRTQNMKSKTKAISLIHIDLRISTVENQWETGATLTSLQQYNNQLFLKIMV